MPVIERIAQEHDKVLVHELKHTQRKVNDVGDEQQLARRVAGTI